MNPSRVDFAADLAYGFMLFVSIILLVFVGTRTGVAFGLGIIVSYTIHVVWKMARFDPDWMTNEVTEEVTENVEETLSEEVDEVINKLEEINERVDRRPRKDEIEAVVDEATDDELTDDELTDGKTVEETERPPPER